MRLPLTDDYAHWPGDDTRGDADDHLARVLEKARLTRHRAVDGFTGAAEISVRSDRGRALPLQVDGDHIGDVTEATYGIARGRCRSWASRARPGPS